MMLPSKEFFSEIQFSLPNLGILLGEIFRLEFVSLLRFVLLCTSSITDLSLHIFSLFNTVSESALAL